MKGENGVGEGTEPEGERGGKNEGKRVGGKGNEGKRVGGKGPEPTLEKF